MPKFNTENDEQFKIPGASNFNFSGTRIDTLGETGVDEYTLVTIGIDVSGSVTPFKDDLLEMLKNIISVCQNHPTSERIMVRVLTFNQNLYEIHGYKEINEINIDDYDDFKCSGMTALYDSTFSAIGATVTYAENLINNNFDANGDIYIITDGCDNISKMTPKSIKDKKNQSIIDEKIESIRMFLIGIDYGGDSYIKKYLEEFKNEASFTDYIDVGSANPSNLGKLANYISKSISAQSQSLGTGGPSQALTF